MYIVGYNSTLHLYKLFWYSITDKYKKRICLFCSENMKKIVINLLCIILITQIWKRTYLVAKFFGNSFLVAYYGHINVISLSLQSLLLTNWSMTHKVVK